MSGSDRRTGHERRGASRHPLELDIEWLTDRGRRSGTLGDVSLDGCFVLCSADVDEGEVVKLYIPLADGMKVEFQGRVANFVNEIGFGVKFSGLSAAQREVLKNLVLSRFE